MHVFTNIGVPGLSPAGEGAGEEDFGVGEVVERETEQNISCYQHNNKESNTHLQEQGREILPCPL